LERLFNSSFLIRSKFKLATTICPGGIGLSPWTNQKLPRYAYVSFGFGIGIIGLGNALHNSISAIAKARLETSSTEPDCNVYVAQGRKRNA
jgi:hypothetical protein